MLWLDSLPAWKLLASKPFHFGGFLPNEPQVDCRFSPGEMRWHMRNRFLNTVIVCIAATCTGLGIPGTAQAVDSPTPVVPDAREHGIVTRVYDGDTVLIHLTSGANRKIRLLSLQAMEQYAYPASNVGIPGECHAAQATVRLRELIDNQEVRLESFKSATKSRGREYRYISVLKDGAWRDVGAYLVAEGLALPMLHPTEYSYNWYYMAFSQWAAQRKVGLFQTDYCGAGPSQDAVLDVGVMWNSPGNDVRNGNGEYMSITNKGKAAVNLAGWWVRDSGLQGKYGRHLTFPAGTVLSVDETIRIHPDKGHTTSKDFYMGDHGPIFENVATGKIFMGDGAYLFDPDGDLRAWKQYPDVPIGSVAPEGQIDPTNPDGIYLYVSPADSLAGIQLLTLIDDRNGELIASRGARNFRVIAETIQ